MSHPLDKPIWSALASRQSGFSSGGALARRFPADVSPFIAGERHDARSIAALVDLIAPDDDVSFLEVAPPMAPRGIAATEAACLQMTVSAFARPRRDAGAQALGEADAAEMLALALLTRPGPFRKRTHTLGRFIGVREGGRLIAMAGERLCVPGFREISAVCTHPDFRGRGLGGALLQQVGERILAEGDTPFLHTYAANTPAIALYEKLGFAVRAEVVHAVWKRT